MRCCGWWAREGRRCRPWPWVSWRSAGRALGWLPSRRRPPLVPQLIIEIDAIPLTASGKVDRRALAARPLPPTAPASLSGTEGLLAAIWREVLGADADRESRFLELGG